MRRGIVPGADRVRESDAARPAVVPAVVCWQAPTRSRARVGHGTGAVATRRPSGNVDVSPVVSSARSRYICTTSTFRKKLAVGDLAVVAAAPSCDQSLDLRQGSVSICVLSAALLVSLAHPLLEAASPVLVPPLNIGHAPRGHAPDTAPPASTPRAAAAEDFCSARQGWRSLGAPAGPRASTSTAVP